ncbi:MAG: HEAT repeat domain-containing protein [Asgard group archaeon]|nr:HEAT repeat domain-containing protein [Asgard group archaeon]
MVQKIHGEARLLSNDVEYKQKKPEKENEKDILYRSMENLTVYELIEIASCSKDKQQRELAVHLLGSKNQSHKEIKAKLWDISAYEHSSIRRAAYWSLAKMDDKKVIPFLLELLATNISEYEKTITINYLGKIGDETTLKPLVQINATVKDQTTISTGMAIHQITKRVGVLSLIDLLYDKDPVIRQEVIWLLSARARFLSKTTERKRILDALKQYLLNEEDTTVRTVIAYNLSTLNIIEGSKELLLLCLLNSVPPNQATSYWNEVVRAFIYRQKESSLKLVEKSLRALSMMDSQDKETKQTKKNLLKLKKSLVKLDKIFEMM